MVNREQKVEAARLKHETRRALAGAIRRGGDAELLADEILQLVAIRYDLVPKQPAIARCTIHTGTALQGRICPSCGPQLDDGG
jgi:glutamate/tyrosine decarboxylase-like PLP-dependent enzyme